MKIEKLLVAIFLTAILIFGWVSFIINEKSNLTDYKNNIAQANQWVGDGLYQRAISKYKSAISYKSTEETWTLLFNAYEKRLQEDTNILSDYIDSLEQATTIYPTNVMFLTKLSDLYIKSNELDLAYNLICTAIENGVTDDGLLSLKDRVQYSFSLDSRTFDSVRGLSNSNYTVSNNGMWGCLESDSTVSKDCVYKYISPLGSDGVRVYTTNSNGSILVDSNNVKLGIFSFNVTDSGVYSCGYIPALNNGKYKYYNSFAKEVFGEYDYAGSFQNNIAPVKIGSKWVFINTNGETISEKFSDVVVNNIGQFCFNNLIVVSNDKGKYYLLNEKLEVLNDFSADYIDICSDKDFIAFKSGEKWGFVNSDGQVVIEPQYSEAKSFSNGLGAVSIDGEWGFVNKANKLVIECQFADVDYFNTVGSCLVRTDVSNVDDIVMWQLLLLNLRF